MVGPSKPSDVKHYINQVWPMRHVEEELYNLFSQDHARVGIIGSGLSAIDMARTLHSMMAEHPACKLEVNMMSRNARFSMVATEPLAAPDFDNVWNKSLNKILQRKSAKEYVEEISGGKVNLKGTLLLFFDILREANKTMGLDYAKIEKLIEFIRAEENIEKIIKEISKNLKPSFEQLRDDLAAARSDQINSYKVLACVFNMFSDRVFANSLRDHFPKDERIFLQHFLRSNLLYFISMPPESAELLLEMHDRGVLDIKAIEHRGRVTNDEQGRVKIGNETNAYDLVLNCSGNESEMKSTHDHLLQSIQQNFGISSAVEMSNTEFEEFKQNAEKKYGKDATQVMMAGIERKGDNYLSQKLGYGTYANDQIVLLRNFGSVNEAYQRGFEIGERGLRNFTREKTIKIISTKQVGVETSDKSRFNW